jgi:thiamine pyrophosphate-dependent acetolactate synthase large subunit-like protein/CDGSH-type Zn-finger protein
MTIMKPVIKPLKNGPLQVRGLENFTDSEGRPIQTSPTMSLCRCGASATMPFCDSTHRRIHFNSARLSGLENDRRVDYKGKRIVIHDNRALCTSAGYCVRGLPLVWRKGKKPWIDPDAAEPEEIISVIRQCPSGALSYSLEGVEGEIAGREPQMQLRKDGPYDVRGGIELVDADFCEGASREHYQLCRCGFSKNKPFCDGMHWQVGYEDKTISLSPGGDQPESGKPKTAQDKGQKTDEDQPQPEQVEPASPPPTLSIADVIVETMINWGVTHVFGMVGGTILGVADAIRRYGEKGQITFIGVRHEGAAAFAASGFAKLSGRPAACLSIAGPGATNLLTGLWDAKADRTPVLALTGQVGMQHLVPGAFQEIDLEDAFQGVCNFSETVMPGSPHAEMVTLALKHAVIGRGVGHLIIPSEVQAMPAPEDERPSRSYGRVEPDQIAPPAESLDEAIRRVAAAEHPAIIVGNGARLAMDRIMRLAERLGCPVISTFKAMGMVDYQHPLCAGLLGTSGMPVAFWAMDNADLLLAFGCSFSEHTGVDASKPIIQVDFDRMSLGRSHPVAVPVWGDAYVTAGLILDGLPDTIAARDQREHLAAEWKSWRQQRADLAGEQSDAGAKPAAVMEALTRLAPEDAVIAIDVGNNTSSFGRYFECRRQTVLLSGYLGAIGFAFPAAIGACVADPRRKTIAVAGDGGFAQYMAEFTTAVKYGMDVTLILLNNYELGMISAEQEQEGWPVWQTSLRNPHFAQFARSCGGFGVRVENQVEIESAISAALAHPGPALVDIKTDPGAV